MDAGQTSLTIRDYPWPAWISGSMLFLGGLFAISIMSTYPYMGIAFLVVGSVLLLVSSILTVTADHMAGILTLRYRSLFWGSSKQIPLSEITAIKLECSSSSDSGTTYRIVLVCQDGQVTPFHSYYSSGRASKQSRVDQLRSFLGVGGQDDETAVSIFSGLPAVQQAQQALSSSESEEHVTDGVHWKLQTVSMGTQSLTRWFSPDCKSSSGFLMLAQKVDGQKTMAGSLLGGVGKFLLQQLTHLYGFGPQDVPALETSDTLEPLDSQLEPHFSALASDPAAARAVLNPWACVPLADWANRYPLKSIQKPGLFGQLVVLYSPQGIYIASLGTFIPEAVDELTALGVALVKAQ
jgi:hypothetical protein